MPDTAGGSPQTRGFDFDSNPALRSLPDHLKQFAVDQVYDRYTPIDHAVWRYIMRQNVFFLKEYAHKVYFDGLLNTGISFERIPRIEEMNDILARIGWGAVAVDGFIPPAAFMEFQAYKVLVIAVDMRQVGHIEYTPAPDIVHEAAGHAPIIVDAEYARYLQRFGEVGAKAMSSRQDFELYEAIRHLSILKESPDATAEAIAAAERDVAMRQENLGEPSEMALLSRLHWWTVEYGLIGSLDAPKIYGAGLLSSIGEAASCLGEHVRKIPYTVDAASYAFDITTQQPQLFVTPDFEHLMAVLEEFAAGMAFRVGGLPGLKKAMQCARVATVELSSGLQISGVVAAVEDDGGEPVLLRMSGPVQLAVGGRELPGHGTAAHAEGFVTPVGLGDDVDEEALGLTPGEAGEVTFGGGCRVSGVFESAVRADGKLVLLRFTEPSVTYGQRVLHAADDGPLDIAVGSKVVSVFHGAADESAYEDISLVPRERTIRVEHGARERALQGLYAGVREVRESGATGDALAVLADAWRTVRAEHPDDWLLAMEMVELLDGAEGELAGLREEIRGYLVEQREKREDRRAVIDWGFRLVEFHRGLPPGG